MVSRDRSQQDALQAEQVADRFHLLAGIGVIQEPGASYMPGGFLDT